MSGSTYISDIKGQLSDKISLSRIMFRHISGGDGTAGPQAFGELYVNFGFFGLGLSLILGFFIQSINILS